MKSERLKSNNIFSAVVNKGLEDEFSITGYSPSWFRTGLSVILTLLLGGLPLLLARWRPRWRLLCTSRQCRLKSATRYIIHHAKSEK